MLTLRSVLALPGRAVGQDVRRIKRVDPSPVMNRDLADTDYTQSSRYSCRCER